MFWYPDPSTKKHEDYDSNNNNNNSDCETNCTHAHEQEPQQQHLKFNEIDVQTADHEQIKSEPEIEVENPSGKNCENEDISSDDFTGQIPIKVHN